MSSWIKSYQALRDHPKTRKLARRVDDLTKAIGMLHCLWWWAMDYAPDGDLSKYDAEDIAIACEWSADPDELIAILADCGFLDTDGNGRRHIHDWSEYGGALLVMREQDAERKRAARAVTVPVDNSTVHETSTGRPPDGERTAHVDRFKREIEKPSRARARGPVDNSTIRSSRGAPMCPDCMSKFSTESVLEPDGHCIICGYAKTPAVAP